MDRIQICLIFKQQSKIIFQVKNQSLRVNEFSNVQWVKKKRNILIYFNTNYRIEVKLVPFIMNYCLLQFDALKIFLGVRLHVGSLSNFNFFYVNSQIMQRNRKVHLSNWMERNFHDIFNIRLRVIRRRNYCEYCRNAKF